MTLWVRKANARRGVVPQWLGGRMPLSTELAAAVRRQLTFAKAGYWKNTELQAVKPLLNLQSDWSVIPDADEVLIEAVNTREGHHLFIYPFEGLLVHEGLSALFAYRISRLAPITLSLSANDYGFELLSDQPIPLEAALKRRLLGRDNLLHDILDGVNASDMARRQFREIARIAGLVFQGYPGREKTTRQITASSNLIYNVFQRYDPDNLLFQQATREVLDRHLEIQRVSQSLKRMAQSRLQIVRTKYPTPLAFPIMVNRIRARLSSEKLADRVRKMQLQLEQAAAKTRDGVENQLGRRDGKKD
jgi:ATP-dependent Lhr-like helicase